MHSIANKEGIKKYSERFTKRTLDIFFKDKEVISGEEMKKLTPVSQVNLFVIRELFQHWQGEWRKLESPYFDYQRPEVRQALKALMNVLSKNIAVKRKDVEPLLLKATESSILLIFLPFDFYARLTDSVATGKASAEGLSKMVRYVKVNEHILTALLEKLKKINPKSVNGEECREILHQVLHEPTSEPEDVERYFSLFNKIETLSKNDIYENSDHLTPEEVSKTPDVGSSTIATGKPKTAASPRATEAPPKRGSIKSVLSINQQYMFQSALFDGDGMLMNKTLEYIDNCSTKKEAFDYLRGKFPHWNIEDEAFEEFMELIDGKLA